MRLAGEIAGIIVKAARSGICPVHDSVDRLHPFGFGLQLPDFSELFIEPPPIVQGVIDRIQTCATIDADSLIPGDA